MNVLHLDLTKNLSYFTVPAVFLVSCFFPHAYAMSSSGTVYNIANPRGWRDAVAKSDIDKPRQQRLFRAKSASENGFEALGMYAAGVVAANLAGVDARTVNVLTLGYLAARIAYLYAYIELGANRRLALVRSVVWIVSMGLCFALWVKAGLKTMG